MTEFISKQSLKADFEKKISSGQVHTVDQPVELVDTRIGLKGVHNVDDKIDSVLNGSKPIASSAGQMLQLSGKYGSALDVPLPKSKMSLREMVAKNMLKGDNLIQNWTDVLDAVRWDITMRKEGLPTIRQRIYNEVVNPNWTKDVRPTELYPYGVVFEENNGTGQSVKLGANNGGASETVPMKIYAAGYVNTLLAQLFDSTWSLERLNDGVAVGYNAKRDNIALKPILDATYSGAKLTPASTEGDNRQEYLYNTLWGGVDALAERKDPILKRRFGAGSNDFIVLASSYDAAHIREILQGGFAGLPNDRNRKYRGLPPIREVIAYDDETIDMPNESITYSGVTQGSIYIIKPNRYMTIPIKRGLTAEFDANPSVLTLDREHRAWYFVEAIYNAKGIDGFIQKVTLPTW